MTENEALHTAARRYLDERTATWGELHRERRFWGCRSAEPSLPPRFRILESMLDEIERLRPGQLGTIEQTRQVLTKAADRVLAALDGTTEGSARLLIQEEHRLFVGHLRDLTRRDLLAVEPLALRRPLSPLETRQLWDRLEKRWEIHEHYWYPLSEQAAPPGVVAFHANPFYDAVSEEAIAEILRDHNLDRYFELIEERDNGHEVEVSAFEFGHTPLETYYTS